MDTHNPAKHREWRGLRDTLCDYFGWLIVWGSILKFLPKVPRPALDCLLSLPAYIDSQLTQLRAFPFRRARRCFNDTVRRSFTALRNGTAVFPDSSVPPELMAGFPELTAIPLRIPRLSLSCRLPLSIDSLLDCIHRIESASGKKFDWDAFFSLCHTPLSRREDADRRIFSRRALLLHCPPELRFGLCGWLEQSFGIVCVEPPVCGHSPKAALENLVRRYDPDQLPELVSVCGTQLVLTFGTETCDTCDLIQLSGKTQSDVRQELSEVECLGLLRSF